MIAQQPYEHVEVCISDDFSTDDTETQIRNFIPGYRFPLKYHRFETNQGYDRNLRNAIEMATGEYVIIIGNDDTINPKYHLKQLSDFLNRNHLPELGYTSYINADTQEPEYRAVRTELIGSGPEVAIQQCSRFSFVGGLIFKRDAYLKFNSGKFEKSVYSQMYMGCLMITSYCQLFSIREPVIIKDILPNEQNRKSFLDNITKSWKNFKIVNGGLPSVVNVLTAAFQDAGIKDSKYTYQVLRKVYVSTLPYWIITYKKHKALPESVGIALGMWPALLPQFSMLRIVDQVRILGLYLVATPAAILIPVGWFERIKSMAWNRINRVPQQESYG